MLAARFLKNKTFYTIFSFGAISGMPISIFISLISVILTEIGLDIAIITSFAICRLPYSLKIFFAPFIDNLPFVQIINLFNSTKIKSLVHDPDLLADFYRIESKKIWMFLSNLFIAITLYVLSNISIADNLSVFKYLCFFIAFLGSIYDISWDGLRIETSTESDRSYGVSLANFGYKFGQTLTGGGVLYLSSIFNDWQFIFLLLSALFILNLVIIFFLSENLSLKKIDLALNENQTSSFKLIEKISLENENRPLKEVAETLLNNIYISISDIFSKKYSILIMMSIISYKACDAFLSSVTMNFYLKCGFTKDQIALVIKLYATIATLLGSIFASYIYNKIGIFKSLMICGAAEAVTNILYIIINHNRTYTTFVTNVIIENFTGGMGSCALMTYLTLITNPKYAGTQYAIYTSAMNIFNILLTQYSGMILNKLSWDYYCIFTALLAVPSLGIIFYLNKYKIYSELHKKRNH